MKIFGPARVGVLESHTGCVETTRPRGVLGLVNKKKKFAPSGVGVLERHIGCVETTRPREKKNPRPRPGYPEFEESDAGTRGAF